MRSAIAHPPADLVGGRYRLGELLHEGGGAWVYRARDEVLERDVALKVLPGGSAAAR